MAANPTVAVVVPYYNGRRYLATALTSVLAQDYPAIEVLVVNDGSPDDFVRAIEPFRNAVRILEQPNQGVATARNHAIASTSAPYVAFLDQDDFWERTKLSRQVEMLEANRRCGIIHTDFVSVDEAGHPIQPPPRKPDSASAIGTCTRRLLLNNVITMSSAVVRREAIGPEMLMNAADGCDDWDLWLRISLDWELEYVAEPLTFIRVHGNNLSSRRDVMLQGVVAVLERAARRPMAGDLAAIAERQLGLARISLAHFEFDQGNRAAARALYRKAMSQLDRVGWTRFGASFLPEIMYRPARALWRGLRSL